MRSLIAISLALPLLVLASCADHDSQKSSSQGLMMEKRGDWNSGGGLALTDALNPWFVQNTKVVKYCVEIDEKNFGQKKEVAEEMIRQSFAHWKKELTAANPARNFNEDEMDINDDGSENNSDEIVLLATQEFQQVPCSKDVDLRFQLGFLRKNQLKKVDNPRKYLAFAMRTGYDTKNLRGKGFIYVSPQTGKLAPNDQQVLQDRWTKGNGRNLLLTLLHEMGHIFGLTYSKHPLMSTKLEFLYDLDKSETAAFWDRGQLKPPYFFSFPEGEKLTHCHSSGGAAARYLTKGIDKAWPCLTATLVDSDMFSLQLSGRDSWSDEPVVLGDIELDKDSRAEMEMGTLVLPREQTVFKNPKKLNHYKLISYTGELKGSGKFTPVNGTKPVPVEVRFNGERLEIDMLTQSEADWIESDSWMFWVTWQRE